MRLIKIFLAFAVAALCICVNINAKSSYRKAVMVGLSTSHPKDFDRFVGCEVGLKGELLFSKSENFYLSSALSFANRGWNMSVYDLDENRYQCKCNVYYLEIPLFVGYKYELPNGIILFGEAGSYAALGLWGQNRLNVGGENFGSDNLFRDGYRRNDWGGRMNIGLNLNEWQWSLGYSQGMLKPTKDYWSVINPHSYFLYLNAAYFF